MLLFRSVDHLLPTLPELPYLFVSLPALLPFMLLQRTLLPPALLLPALLPFMLLLSALLLPAFPYLSPNFADNKSFCSNFQLRHISSHYPTFLALSFLSSSLLAGRAMVDLNMLRVRCLGPKTPQRALLVPLICSRLAN